MARSETAPSPTADVFHVSVEVHASGSPPARCAVTVPIGVQPPLPPMSHVTTATPSPLRPLSVSWTLPVSVPVEGSIVVTVGLLDAACHTAVAVAGVTAGLPAGMSGSTS